MRLAATRPTIRRKVEASTTICLLAMASLKMRLTTKRQSPGNQTWRIPARSCPPHKTLFGNRAASSTCAMLQPIKRSMLMPKNCGRNIGMPSRIPKGQCHLARKPTDFMSITTAIGIRCSAAANYSRLPPCLKQFCVNQTRDSGNTSFCACPHPQIPTIFSLATWLLGLRREVRPFRESLPDTTSSQKRRYANRMFGG